MLASRGGSGKRLQANPRLAVGRSPGWLQPGFGGIFLAALQFPPLSLAYLHGGRDRGRGIAGGLVALVDQVVAVLGSRPPVSRRDMPPARGGPSLPPVGSRAALRPSTQGSARAKATAPTTIPYRNSVPAEPVYVVAEHREPAGEGVPVSGVGEHRGGARDGGHDQDASPIMMIMRFSVEMRRRRSRLCAPSRARKTDPAA